MRTEELAGRPGKQADGSSKTREMKLCAIWTADARDRDGRPTRDEGSITYTAAIERAETRATDKLLAPFARRVEREAQRGGSTRPAEGSPSAMARRGCGTSSPSASRHHL